MNALILRPDHIGDMLLTTPFLAALRKAFPEWNITVLCGSWTFPVLENNPNYNNVVLCNYPWLARDGKASWKAFLSTIAALRSKKFDIVFNLRKAAKAASVARAIKGRQTWGFDVRKSAWAHTNTIPYRTDCHIADLYLEFVNAQGVRPEHYGLEFYLKEEEISDFYLKLELPERYVVLAPGAGYQEKLWLQSRWAETACFVIRELNFPVVFTGSAAERTMIKSIVDNMRETAIDLTGQLSIRQAGVLVKKAQFVVSVDTAAMHIASAVRTPVVALFGPTNPAHWGPYPNGRANRVLSKVTEFKLGRGSTNKAGGMELITVEDVKSAMYALCDTEKINVG